MWFKTPSSAPDWSAAQRHLSAADPVLRRIIRRVGPCTLHPRRDYFVLLCMAIFNQQISLAAAAKLFARFRDCFPRRRPTPRLVLQHLHDPGSPIHACGLSRSKKTYLIDLANGFVDGRIPTRKFARMSDEDIIAHLTQIKGIGRWTAEMFLMFVLNRPDVLPVDDLGLQEKLRLAYGLRRRPKPLHIRRVAQCWRPWRTIGTWYLWRSGD